MKCCPFCGGRAKVRYRRPISWVECRKCKASTLAVPDWDEEADGKTYAVELWEAGKVLTADEFL